MILSHVVCLCVCVTSQDQGLQNTSGCSWPSPALVFSGRSAPRVSTPVLLDVKFLAHIP